LSTEGPAPLARLVAELSRLPGIGQRTAQRLAFHLLRAPDEEAFALGEAIREVKEKVGLCEVCFNLAEGPLCRICSDTARDQTTICVVEEPGEGGEIAEVVLATNPTTTGEATALYIAELMRGPHVSVTRLASGLPVGADLEHADEVTLGKALAGRRSLD
jgi:recombination protein RecR